jgi:hypothetical protein
VTPLSHLPAAIRGAHPYAGHPLPVRLPVETAPLAGTSGTIDESRLCVSWGGAVPIQGDGMVIDSDGNECCVYYRARGEGWGLSIAKPGGDPLDDDAWTYERAPYFWPDGGWLAARVSERNIREAVKAWREAGEP